MKYILLFKLFVQVQGTLIEQNEIVQCARYVVECAKLIKFKFEVAWVVFLLTCHFACMGARFFFGVKQWFQNQN
jgi:hypothetical protein